MDLTYDVQTENTITFDQGDRDLDASGDRIKFESGRTYRLSFVIFPATADKKPDFTKPPRWWQAERYWNSHIKQYVVYDDSHRRFLTGTDKARHSAATVVILWPTDSKGKLDPGRIEMDSKVGYVLLDKDKYANIKALQDEYPLGDNDVMVTCTDTNFQKITVRNTKGNMFEQMAAKAAADPNGAAARIVGGMLDRIKRLAVKLNGSEIAHKLTAAEVDNKIRGAAAGGRGGAAGAAAAASASVPSAEEIDNLIGNLK